MRIRNVLRDDSGVAMIAVIGTLALVTVISIAAFTMSRQSMHETGVVRANSQAFQLANAGLDVALANIQANGFNPPDPDNPDVAEWSGAIDGVGDWSVKVSPESDSQYLAESTGVDASTGTIETVRTKFFYLNIWEMNIAGDEDALTAGGGGITGTSNVTGPFYVVGNIKKGGTSFIHDGPFFVKGGDIELSGNATIGAVDKWINVYVSGDYPSTRFYANASHAVPAIVLPRIDEDYISAKWSIARAESTDNTLGTTGISEATNLEANLGVPATYTNYDLGGGTYLTRNAAPGASAHYKYIGPAEGPAGVRSGTTIGQGSTELVIGGSTPFGAWSGPGGAYPTDVPTWDDFAWDPATDTLYVEGTVFVDGDVRFTRPSDKSNDPIYYRGNGTIIANGDIHIDAFLIPLGSENVPATMPLDHDRALGLVTPENIIIHKSSNNLDPSNPPQVAGALYAGRQIEFKNNILFKGSVIAGSMKFGHPNVHLVTDPRLPSFLPDGMPGRNMSMLTRGTWAR